MLKNILILISLILITHINCDDSLNKVQYIFTKDYEEIKAIKTKSKIASCLALVSNNLNEGNNSVKEAINKSKFDKSKSYDKILSAMINNCVENIQDADIEKVKFFLSRL